MPLFVPASGGLDRRILMGGHHWYSDAINTFIEILSGFYDPVTDQAVFSGRSSYVGFISDFHSPNINIAAALPNTVITNTDMMTCRRNRIDNGILVKSLLNEVARSDDGGATWVDITPAPALGVIVDIVSWRGRLTILSDTAIITQSTDNGATWTVSGTVPVVAPGGGNYLYTNNDETTLISLNARSLSWTKDDDPTNPLNWVLLDVSGAPFSITSGWQSQAINDAGDKAVMVANTGTIVVTSDDFASFQKFPNELNPFTNANNVPQPTPQACVYWPGENGFLLFSGTASVGVVLFIPADGDLLTGITGNYMASAAPAYNATHRNPCVSNGADVISLAAGNFGVNTLRPAD